MFLYLSDYQDSLTLLKALTAMTTPSQRVMKEKPRKSPRVPPNSATREVRVCSSTSCCTLVWGDTVQIPTGQS